MDSSSGSPILPPSSRPRSSAATGPKSVPSFSTTSGPSFKHSADWPSDSWTSFQESQPFSAFHIFFGKTNLRIVSLECTLFERIEPLLFWSLFWYFLIFIPLFAHFRKFYHALSPLKTVSTEGHFSNSPMNMKFFYRILRFLGGMADAAAWGAVVSILMKLFPSHVTTIASWTEMLLGLGYMLGTYHMYKKFKSL